MEFSKKIEVQYKDGSKIMHTFEVLSASQRADLFEIYVDMKKASQGQIENALDLIKEEKSPMKFVLETLKYACPTLDNNKIPAYEADRLFEEIGSFVLDGGLKN